jgi:hypothetical protein
MSEFFPLRQSGNKNYCALCGFSASFAVSFYMKISQFYIELTLKKGSRKGRRERKGCKERKTVSGLQLRTDKEELS